MLAHVEQQHLHPARPSGSPAELAGRAEPPPPVPAAPLTVATKPPVTCVLSWLRKNLPSCSFRWKMWFSGCTCRRAAGLRPAPAARAATRTQRLEAAHFFAQRDLQLLCGGGGEILHVAERFFLKRASMGWAPSITAHRLQRWRCPQPWGRASSNRFQCHAISASSGCSLKPS